MKRRQANRRTKIVATIGPASRHPKVLRQLRRAGMDVARLNMSHGTHAEHAEVISRLRELDPQIGVLVDLAGPKVRTGPNQDGEPIQLKSGRTIELSNRTKISTPTCLAIPQPGLMDELQAGSRLLLDDGQLQLRVEGIQGHRAVCRIVVGGALGDRKGVHLPGAWAEAPSLTRKDKLDFAFAVEQRVDLVALSFVRRAADVEVLGRLMRRRRFERPILAKLETVQALDHLGAIVDQADGVMVARGDLGLDLPPEEVPLAQKRIIDLANLVGKPVITATQMLESMTANPLPTRAEATDVANAVLDGTDAVMLSGETASGQYPVRAVDMMARIVTSTEAHETVESATPIEGAPVNAAVAHAAADLARYTGARALVVFTLSGRTARLIARQRPGLPIYALTPSDHVARGLSHVWGIEALLMQTARTTGDMITAGEVLLRKAHCVKAGDLVVAVVGTVGQRGASNAVHVLRVGR